MVLLSCVMLTACVLGTGVSVAATRNDATMVPLRFASESLGLEAKRTQK